MPSYNLNVGGTEPTWRGSELDVHEKMAERPAQAKPAAAPELPEDVLKDFHARQTSYAAARTQRKRDADRLLHNEE